MRVAIISDVHSAYSPFIEAVRAARKEGFDQLILLGDLFTYGVNPVECSELAQDLVENDGALLIEGNHDQVYRALENGESAYYNSLPDWIRESVNWTWNELGRQWPRRLECIPEWHVDTLLFAHANPFEFGDWTYLADTERLSRAAETCVRRGYRFGIFGHLHRSNHYRSGSVELHIVGSIGQPRSLDDRTPHWAMAELSDGELIFERHRVAFDPKVHCTAIWNTPSLSDVTKRKLCRYFE